MISGSRRASAVSMARTIFSPITTPMLPPMKAYSMAADDRLDAVDAADADDDRVVRGPVALLAGGEALRGRAWCR